MPFFSLSPAPTGTRPAVSPARLFPVRPLSPKNLQQFRSFISLPAYSRLRCLCTVADSAVFRFEEVVERDWSFLETDEVNSWSQRKEKVDRIISTAQIGGDSRVLVSIGTEDFVDRLVESSNCSLLLVVHYSLLSLALIKEKYDAVRCWQGEFVEVPGKWAPFDVVFLLHLPVLNSSLDRIFEVLAARCSIGARVIICNTQGRGIVEQQRQQHPDAVTSDLPDKTTLEKVSAEHSFEIIDFVDEPAFYLAVLKLGT